MKMFFELQWITRLLQNPKNLLINFLTINSFSLLRLDFFILLLKDQFYLLCSPVTSKKRIPCSSGRKSATENCYCYTMTFWTESHLRRISILYFATINHIRSPGGTKPQVLNTVRTHKFEVTVKIWWRRHCKKSKIVMGPISFTACVAAINFPSSFSHSKLWRLFLSSSCHHLSKGVILLDYRQTNLSSTPNYLKGPVCHHIFITKLTDLQRHLNTNHQPCSELKSPMTLPCVTTRPETSTGPWLYTSH